MGNDESDLASRRLLAVTEEELSRIVLDIHDGPVQYLFAALSLLTRMQYQMEGQPTTPDLLPTVNRVTSLVEESLQEIRSFFGHLSPTGIPAPLDHLDGARAGDPARRAHQQHR